MPETPVKIWEQLGVKDSKYKKWDSAKEWGLYPENAKVKKGNVIFPRIDLKAELGSLKKNEKNKVQNDKKEDSEDIIQFDEFKKVKMKTAKVIEAEKVKGTDKLLKLKLKVGDSERQVISGIAKYYDIDNIVGKTVILVTNLKPVKIRGELSEGMILAAEDKNRLSLLTCDKEIDEGTDVT